MYYLGLDIGGWKMRGLVWDGWRVVAAYEFRTPRTKAEFVRTLRLLVAKLSGRVRGHIPGIGVGAAGVIQGTSLLMSPNISYLKRFDFRTLFPAVPLSLDNDARAFARAEWRYSAGRRKNSILAVTIGTGIGRAYGRKNRIVRIKKFEHPESWEPEYQRIRDQGKSKELAEFIAVKLAGLVAFYRPEVLVLGGGIIDRPTFFEKLRAELKRNGVGTPIRRARFGRNAAAIGAAMLLSKR